MSLHGADAIRKLTIRSFVTRRCFRKHVKRPSRLARRDGMLAIASVKTQGRWARNNNVKVDSKPAGECFRSIVFAMWRHLTHATWDRGLGEGHNDQRSSGQRRPGFAAKELRRGVGRGVGDTVHRIRHVAPMYVHPHLTRWGRGG